MSLTLEDLTISPEGIDPVALLADWEWAMEHLMLPVLVTAMGDVFAQSDSGEVCFIDVVGGEIVPVCDSTEAFEEALDDEEFVDEFFYPERVLELRAAGLTLGNRQVYSHKVPLVVGGDDEASNFEVSDAVVHISVHGQIHRQVKDLPEGAPLGDIEIIPPDVP
ncbi:DUF1851 domain-containing protein [bacterium]|nr:DUF1851 domain-containing protein [bacterium]